MTNPIETYTYRGGEKVNLVKSAGEFVVAAPSEVLQLRGYSKFEPVTSTANRVTVASGDLEFEMARARFIAPTHHSYTLSDTGQEFVISDRIFVTFQQGVSLAQIETFMAQYAVIPVEKYSDSEFLFRLTNHTGMNPIKLINKLVEDEPNIESADHDLYYRVQKYAFRVPTDQYFGYQWHLHTHLQHPEYDARSSSRCEDAWRLLDGFGASEIVVGISDDGCQLDHADFDAPNKFAGWAYWESNSASGTSKLVTNNSIGADRSKMYVLDQDHGTGCAGVVGAEADSVLTIGAAPGCGLLPVRYESEGSWLFISDSNFYATLKYLSDKIDVMSNSWGSTPLNLFAPTIVKLIRELAVTGGRRGKGILFVWAAGNENCPINYDSSVAVPYTNGWTGRGDLTGDPWAEWVGVQAAFRFRNELATIPGVMHIAALASNAQRSHYSNYGSGIDLCAPTSNGHKYFRAIVPGLPIVTTNGTGNPPLQRFGGTSSAAPLVAGIAALVLSANPELTALEVESILKRTASKDLDQRGYPSTLPAAYDPNPLWDVSPVAPFNKGDFQDLGEPEGTWSPWFGHGRVDASAAVAEALRLRTPSSITKNGKNGHASSRKVRSVERSVAER